MSVRLANTLDHVNGNHINLSEDLRSLCHLCVMEKHEKLREELKQSIKESCERVEKWPAWKRELSEARINESKKLYQ